METLVRRGPRQKDTIGLPNRARQLRQQRGLMLKEVAALLGIEKQTLSIYETKGRGLGKHKIYRLADLYNIDPRELDGHTPKNFQNE